MMQKVPRIRSQSERYLQLEVPSKSHPGEVQIVEYKPNGSRECSCVGAYWFKEKGQDLYKSCRHQKMTTIPLSKSYMPPPKVFKIIKYLIGNKRIALSTAWGNICCAHPNYRNDSFVRCAGCPLYPEVCNIHKIKYGRGPRARVPLIWRLQEACYNNKRGKARKLINSIIKAIEELEA